MQQSLDEPPCKLGLQDRHWPKGRRNGLSLPPNSQWCKVLRQTDLITRTRKEILAERTAHGGRRLWPYCSALWKCDCEYGLPTEVEPLDVEAALGLFGGDNSLEIYDDQRVIIADSVGLRRRSKARQLFGMARLAQKEFTSIIAARGGAGIFLAFPHNGRNGIPSDVGSAQAYLQSPLECRPA